MPRPSVLPLTEVRAAVEAPERLAAVRRLAPWDTTASPALDELTRTTAETLAVPVALLTLVDIDRQWVKSSHGLPEPLALTKDIPLAHSLCQYAVAARVAFVVGDAAGHPQLRAHPAVQDLGVRAYAGRPIFYEEQAVGALCGIDVVPRTWTRADRASLERLAADVTRAVEVLVRERSASHRRAWRQRDVDLREAVSLEVRPHGSEPLTMDVDAPVAGT
jgi:GAF domain-containing protein